MAEAALMVTLRDGMCKDLAGGEVGSASSLERGRSFREPRAQPLSPLQFSLPPSLHLSSLTTPTFRTIPTNSEKGLGSREIGGAEGEVLRLLSLYASTNALAVQSC